MEREINKDIVSKLIQDGLTPRQIQDCYERYVWHVDFYEPKLKKVEEELERYKLMFGDIDKRDDRMDKEIIEQIREEYDDIEMRCSYIVDNMFEAVGLRRYDTEKATDLQIEKLERILTDIEQVILGTLSSYNPIE